MPGVSGVHVMAYRQEDSVPEIIDRSGVLGGRVPWYPGRDPQRNTNRLGLMTDTIISSATREVVIGFERPFVMIGERINPTGRKILAAEMGSGDFTRVEADARAQVAAGAHMLDVNAGIPLADEPAILAKAVQLVQSIDGRAAVHRLLYRRRAGGGPRRLQGQAARQFRHRRGRASGIGPAAGEEVRRRGGGDLQ